VVEDPPLKTVLVENRVREDLNHLGVEVQTSGDVSAAFARFRGAGLTTTADEKDLCSGVGRRDGQRATPAWIG